jgi:aminopeptidase N
MTFSGEVTIKGKQTKRPSQRITLHQKGLKIESAKIIHHDKKEDRVIKVSRINLHSAFDEVRLHTESQLYPGSYSITLKFSGKIKESMSGIYPSFFEMNGKKHTLITTQFESHHAREAFPCIDEPEAKATFNLTLTSPINETVISNTPVVDQVEKNGLWVTTFDTTPKMSTYLLAFCFGELSYMQAETKDGVIVRTYATPENISYSKFALDTAIKTLEFFNEYFDIPYPLLKCDLVALPDFAAGAMENWGMITFREQAMLVDPKNTSIFIKQHVALVVAHELAHQWFGNLVTMKWWNDLWLNEGFASWIEHLALDKLFPKWNVWTQFAVDDNAPAFKLDALANSHPIKASISHPDEIRSIFDAISYSKGSSVINMLHTYLGPELFRDGLRAYLKENAYSNATTEDLWQSLEKVSKMPVSRFMDAWTSQVGFPIVFVESEGGKIKLHQEKFLLNPVSRKKNDENLIWPIPLHMVAGDHELMDIADKIVLPKTKGPLKLNLGQTGFYRVKYDTNHLEKLSLEVLNDKLSPIDRLGLISDVFEVAKAGFGETTEALNLIKGFAKEENPVVWDIIALNIGSLRGVMNDEHLRNIMKPFIRKLISIQLKRLGWDEIIGESHSDKLLRNTILALASSADEPSIIKRINSEFKKLKTSEDIRPDVRGIVYGTIAREGGSVEFNKLLKLYKDTNSSEERVTLTAALTGFKQPALIIKALDLIISENVRLQDVTYWVGYSFSNRHAKVAVWEWMTDHWDWLKTNLGDDMSFYRYPSYAASAFSDISFLPTYKKFFNKVMEPTLAPAIRQGVEVIQWQSSWRKRDLSKIKKFFEEEQ